MTKEPAAKTLQHKILQAFAQYDNDQRNGVQSTPSVPLQQNVRLTFPRTGQVQGAAENIAEDFAQKILQSFRQFDLGQKVEND